ncbi:hypothetical protein P691DRAFT_794963 [Macrolepiota fuliginosa MF-IS2]|uniref:RRM domain-containing protein n=1 Tax=Macrolepiota fuliginosa MF-IS2 TaxID=1400762 RepID=A0A9P6BZD0_9AGAR|nr:hypothetical protein P691DRAFT_794963 [Macrolepiota fuliginosa MF-IS2]
MAANLSGLSASVTRILYLTGFSKELKTKDIQSAFAEFENQSGGFKIKWKDDTSLLIVFQDPTVAKRAYLHTLAFPPSVLVSPINQASIRPYDGPDAQAIIQNVNSRGQHNPSASRSHNARSASISVFPNARSVSGTINPNYRSLNPSASNNSNQHIAIPEYPNGREREPSPTLPSLPSHPTLNSLISSSLGEAVAGSGIPSDPAILTTSLQASTSESSGGPRIGDSGKRMLGHALGVRHPSLGPRVVSGNGRDGSNGIVDQTMRGVQRAMEGLVAAE